MRNTHKIFIKFIVILAALLCVSKSCVAQKYFDDNHKPIIIFIIPETGKYKNVGNQIKNSIAIYLTNFQKNNKKIIFIDEGKDFLPLTDLAVSYYRNISLIIGPVFSKNTIKLSNFLKQRKLDIPIYSLSNNSSLQENSNIKTFGFNVNDKISMLFDSEEFIEKDFDEIILLYYKQKLNKSFRKYFVKKSEEKLSVVPVTYPFNNVRSFSRILKMIEPKDQKEFDNQEDPKKIALIFLGLNKQISKSLNDFLLKYKFNSPNYEFYFFSDITKYTKFSDSLRPSVNIVEYNFNAYEKFINLYNDSYGMIPSKISLSAFDAMEASDVK